MKENKLQKEICDWFSQQWPELYGHLFHVNNAGFTPAQRNYLNSMGQIPGVADLLYFGAFGATLAGIEIKGKGSKHQVNHIKAQVTWGRELVRSGGAYCISSDRQTLQDFLHYLVTGNGKKAKMIGIVTIGEVERQIDAGKKTIKF